MIKMDEEFLRRRYVEQMKGLQEIADELGVAATTVRRMMRKFDIPCRKRGRIPEDLTGFQSGKLVVESMAFDAGRSRCVCRCECGKRKIIDANRIKGRYTKSCGCERIKCNKNSRVWAGYGDISGTYWCRIVTNAKQSKKVKHFSITIEYAWQLYQQQNGKCALTGLPIGFAATRAAFQKGETTASLDRIDSTGDYVEGNVQWLHKDVNRAKNDLSQERFLDICRLVTEWKSR